MEKRKILLVFYSLLFFGGIALYLAWNIAYGVWTDVGIYSVTIIMVLLGLFGMLLYSKEREEIEEED